MVFFIVEHPFETCPLSGRALLDDDFFNALERSSNDCSSFKMLFRKSWQISRQSVSFHLSDSGRLQWDRRTSHTHIVEDSSRCQLEVSGFFRLSRAILRRSEREPSRSFDMIEDSSIAWWNEFDSSIDSWVVMHHFIYKKQNKTKQKNYELYTWRKGNIRT